MESDNWSLRIFVIVRWTWSVNRRRMILLKIPFQFQNVFNPTMTLRTHLYLRNDYCSTFMLFLYRIIQNTEAESSLQQIFIPLSVSLWNDLGDPEFDGVGLSGFKSKSNAFLLAYSCSLPFYLPLISLSLLSFYGLVLWGSTESSDWEESEDSNLSLSQPCIVNFFN